jgi:hypothetical protein
MKQGLKRPVRRPKCIFSWLRCNVNGSAGRGDQTDSKSHTAPPMPLIGEPVFAVEIDRGSLLAIRSMARRTGLKNSATPVLFLVPRHGHEAQQRCAKERRMGLVRRRCATGKLRSEQELRPTQLALAVSFVSAHSARHSHAVHAPPFFGPLTEDRRLTPSKGVFLLRLSRAAPG